MKKAKKKLLYFGLPVLILIIVLIWLGARKPKAEYTTVKAVTDSLTQTVSETGTIKPVKEISLNFLGVGRIKSADVKIGDSVLAGDLLASLDDSSLVLRRIEAEAGLSIAQANLSKLLAGVGGETILVSRRSLDQARTAENSARLDLEKTERTILENIRQAEKTYNDLISKSPDTPTAAESAVNSAEVAFDNAQKTAQKTLDNAKSSLLLVLGDKILTVKVAMDSVLKIFDDEDVEHILSAKNVSYKSQTENARLKVLESLPVFESLYAKTRQSSTREDLLSAANSLSDILYNSGKVLDLSYLMLDATITSASFTQSELDAYKSSMISQSAQINAAASALEASTQAYRNAVLTYDTSISTAKSSLDQAKNALETAILNAFNNLNNVKLNSEQQHLSAKSRLESAIRSRELAEAQYNNTIAPARSQDISLVEAQVSQAQAALANIDKQIEDSLLVAPLDGVITAVNYEAGEQFSGSMPMIKMLVDNSFNIEVDISESNITKLKVGDPVEVTLDAFSDDFILDGFVSFIEPAQTLISGVVYYKVKIEFNDLNEVLEETLRRGLSLKSGMTANAVITTDKRENVISVPARAIIERENFRSVRLLVNGEVQEMPVETGLRGDNGQIEIISGVKVGDEVITFIKNGE